MKKKIALAIVAVLVILLFIYGPALLGGYRLQQHIAASAEADIADGGPWPRLTDTCIGCHGVRGHSLHQGYPSLAGQPAPYIAAQLQAFAGGQRANVHMGPLAKTLSAADIKGLADYFAGQTPSENRYFKPDAAQQAKGKQLVEAGGCAACHGATLSGQDAFPRLAGQGYDYLTEQLDAYAAGKRTEATGTMVRLASAASRADRRAIAAYLASQPPTAR